MKALGAIGVAVAMLFTGCRFQGIDLVRDDRVEIVSPADRAEVRQPVIVQWTARDVPPEHRQFAVVVDGPVQPPGSGLDWYARDDPFCETVRGCPDIDYLARASVFVTRAYRVRIPGLLARSDVSPSRRDHHEVTVVLLDGRGRRVGEAAGFVEFRVHE